MEVKLYQGEYWIESTVTDIGGNYHFTGLDHWYLPGRACITGSECTPDHSQKSRTD